jgi:hypothetical protein
LPYHEETSALIGFYVGSSFGSLCLTFPLLIMALPFNSPTKKEAKGESGVLRKPSLIDVLCIKAGLLLFGTTDPKQQPYFQPKGALLPKGSKVLEKGKDKES